MKEKCKCVHALSNYNTFEIFNNIVVYDIIEQIMQFNALFSLNINTICICIELCLALLAFKNVAHKSSRKLYCI